MKVNLSSYSVNIVVVFMALFTINTALASAPATAGGAEEFVAKLKTH